MAMRECSAGTVQLWHPVRMPHHHRSADAHRAAPVASMPPPWHRARAAGLAVLLLTFAACRGDADWQLQGLIGNGLDEVSGFAPAPGGGLWALQDGGNPAALYRLDRHGRLLATWPVSGVQNTDWESLAGFRRGGRDWLLVADTGDNGGLRRTLQLHVFAEPGSGPPQPIVPAWSIVFRWPDGPRDCEAVAVDSNSNQVLLVSKKRQPPELFAVPLGMADGVRTARLLGRLAGVPRTASGNGPPTPDQRMAHWVTGLDLSPDGRQLAVLTYSEVLLYARRDQEPWATAITRAPRIVPLPTLLPQAEAIAWSADGQHLHVSGEFSPAPIYRLSLDTATAAP